ncbi:hypothetical protein ACFQMA_07605 [Halosimplex aquaticum]|uniref:Uncharacterized protein n=1 Tax=Halosimplex aquaticum TaxID=3026162 RepID=A0ABD5Y5N7_9EURY|nr:hypothetical protein [Halosimplex aquaticum]
MIGLLGVAAFQAGLFATPGHVERQPYPDKPADLTEQRVTQYAKACENATVWNEELTGSGETPTQILVSMDEVMVSNRSTGWTVQLSYMVGVHSPNRVGDSTGAAAYFVNESTTLRTVGAKADHGELDPRRNGSVVTRC